MGTESRNPRSMRLDQMSAAEIVRLMNDEEAYVVSALESAEKKIAAAAERAAQAFAEGGRIVYVGAGTSGRIATMDAAEMPPTFGVEPDRFQAVIAGGTEAGTKAKEGAEDDTAAAAMALDALKVAPPDIVIGIAASGSTPFVLAAIAHARQKGVWTCGISNNGPAPLLDAADLGIFLDTGPEILTGSTRLKAGTSQKLVLNRISTIAMVLNGKVAQNLMIDVKAKNAKLMDRCARIVCELTPLDKVEAIKRLEFHDWNIRSVLRELD